MWHRWPLAVAAITVTAIATIVAVEIPRPNDRARSSKPSTPSRQHTQVPSVAESFTVAPPMRNEELSWIQARQSPALRPQTTKEVQISFPDGATVAVKLQSGLPARVHLDEPVHRLTDVYAEFRRRAEAGEAVAATFLHSQLEYCKRAYKDEASLKQALEQFRRDKAVILPIPDIPGMNLSVEKRRLRADTPEKVAEFEEVYFKQPYEYCKGISDEQTREAQTWLRMAADQGEFWALQETAALLGNSPEGVAIWESLWKQGNSGAVQPLAIFHQRGVGGGPPDYVRAYAYTFLHFKLLEAAYQNPPTQIPSGMLQAAEDVMRYSDGFLNPQQQEAAVQLARQLLLENRNCCNGGVW